MTEPSGRVTRDDFEDKLRALRTSADTTATAAKPTAVTVIAVAAVAALAVAYMLGRRKGRKKSAVIEIRGV